MKLFLVMDGLGDDSPGCFATKEEALDLIIRHELVGSSPNAHRIVEVKTIKVYIPTIQTNCMLKVDKYYCEGID